MLSSCPAYPTAASAAVAASVPAPATAVVLTNNNVNKINKKSTPAQPSQCGSNSGNNINPASAAVSTNKPNKTTTVCRDFLRNVCNRGKNCKFAHRELTAASADEQEQQEVAVAAEGRLGDQISEADSKETKIGKLRQVGIYMFGSNFNLFSAQKCVISASLLHIPELFL